KFPTAPTGADRNCSIPCITGGQGSGLGGYGKKVEDFGLDRIGTAVAIANGNGIGSRIGDYKGGPALVTASDIVLEGVLRLRTRGQGRYDVDLVSTGGRTLVDHIDLGIGHAI